jgi:hypothetical protein
MIEGPVPGNSSASALGQPTRHGKNEPIRAIRSVLSGGRGLPAEAEHCPVAPHAVQDDGKLAAVGRGGGCRAS